LPSAHTRSINDMAHAPQPLQYPAPGTILPPSTSGPAKLWVLQAGFNSPTTPGGALNGITSDFAPAYSSVSSSSAGSIHAYPSHVQHQRQPSAGAPQPYLAPKTPQGSKTPKTPRGVAVPSRDSNLTELGFPNWVLIFDGVLRKVQDEQYYGNCLGLAGGAAAGPAGGLLARASQNASLTAQSVADLLQSVIGAHLPAWKAFLNSALRAVPSALPNSPNPLAISGPIPPLSQQLLLQSLSAFLRQSLLPHQLSLVLSQLSGQCHYILGRVLRGANFPVDTHVQGPLVSGGNCGLRMYSTPFQARIAVLRSYMYAAQARWKRKMEQQQAYQPLPAPLFYLSPSFAHALGFPESLPRLCAELGPPGFVTAASFKVLPLTPALDETLLASLPRSPNRLDAREEAAPMLASPGGHTMLRSPTSPNGNGALPVSPNGGDAAPNPFLTYTLDAQSLDAEVAADLAQLSSHTSGASPPLLPCGVFATLGTVAGLDLPYEYDDLPQLAAVCRRFQIMLHVEGSNMFGTSSPTTGAGAATANGGASLNGNQQQAAPAAALFDCADSILLSPGSWVGLVHAPSVVAYRDPALLPASSPARGAALEHGLWTSLGQHASVVSLGGGGGTPSTEEFGQLFALWFNLIQIHAASFDTLLARLAAKQAEKVMTVRRLIAAQPFPSFVAPVGEQDEERDAYLQALGQRGGASSAWLPPAPSHPHLFFALSVPAPWSPRDFHMDRSTLNGWLSARLSARLTAKQGDYVAACKVFGLSLLPVQHFDRVGLMYVPSPTSIWTSDASVEEEVSLVARLFSEVVQAELALLETQARLRAEFEEVLLAEAGGNFLYVHPRDIEWAPGVHPGLGGVRFTPAQIPEQHAEEVNMLLQEALSRVQSSWHTSSGGAVPLPAQLQQQQLSEDGESHAQFPSSSAPPPPGLVSMYRQGRTVDGGRACTVLEVSELVARKGLRDLLAELRGAAARLQYPQHILDDMAETLRQGIRQAEERMISTRRQAQAEAIRPTNVLRWVPLVGSVLNWVAPSASEEAAAAANQGQSFDMKKKELSSIKYSYSAGPANAAQVGGAGTRRNSQSGHTGASGPNGDIRINPSAPAGPNAALFPTPSSATPLSINPTGLATTAPPMSTVAASSTASSFSTGSAGAPLPSNGSLSNLHLQQQQTQQASASNSNASTPTSLSGAGGAGPSTGQAHGSGSGSGSSPSQPPSRKPSALQLGQQPPVPTHSGAPTGAAPAQAAFQSGPAPQQQQQAPLQTLQTTPPTSTSPPQQVIQPQAQPQSSVPSQAAPASSSSNPPPVLPPVRISLDEADRDFVELLNHAPRVVTAEQMALLTRGENFLAYFPNEDETTDVPAAAAAASASGTVSPPPSTSVTKLCLFLEPAYRPSAEEALELGVAPQEPVSLLCWCEPNVTRYVKTDQAVAVEQVAALHLGASAVFPRQAVRANCFSIVTQHVQLHLEADASNKRRDWFLALYTLVSQAPAVPTQAPQPQQQPQPQQPLSGSSFSSSSVSPPQAPLSGVSSSSGSTVSSASTASVSIASAGDEEESVLRARGLLEGGMPFVVYVLDKHDSDLTTRHEVVLFYRPPQPGGVPHSLCWCRRGAASLDFSPARSLPLNRTVQICMGKQTKAFKNPAASGADPAACFSVMVEKMILNLEAPSADQRARWLSAFHALMSAAGKRRVFDAEAEQAQQQQHQQQQHPPQPQQYQQQQQHTQPQLQQPHHQTQQPAMQQPFQTQPYQQQQQQPLYQQQQQQPYPHQPFQQPPHQHAPLQALPHQPLQHHLG